ncbi:MAG: glycerol acyltransferase [Muribaculaceae bacterium]|nr:glycerol acyltransferase [Muribaculaceae bacterium]
MNITNETTPMRIDVDAVLRQRLGTKYRRIPRFVIRALEKIVCQDKLNRLLKENAQFQGADFCHGVLSSLGITVSVSHPERLPKAPDSDMRCIFACNHPLGGLDGMALIDYFTSISPTGRVWFVVNDLLMAVTPLRCVFLPVNKHGRQSREAALRIEEAFSGPDPILVFPAGLVSRKQKGGIFDLAWNKMFIQKAIQYRRDIIPLHFSGRNSSFFYNFALARKRLGIKFNIEMILLPREIFNNTGARFIVTPGDRIPWQELVGGSDAAKTASSIRQKVYQLAEDEPTTDHPSRSHSPA